MSRDVGLPVVVVTGVSPTALTNASLALQWDLPNPVVVAHDIDSASQTLTRTVSDISGVLEREQIDLAHACISCAIREDVIPTLRRVAALDRWGSAVCRLPVGAEATQLCRVAAYDPAQLDGVRIASVVNTLDGCTAKDDLTGQELLCERGTHCFDGDERGVAETATRLLEYADVVAVDGDLDAPCEQLVHALAHPGAEVIQRWISFDASALVTRTHAHRSIERWVAEVPQRVPHRTGPRLWRLELRSDRPIHPRRLQDYIEVLGAGPHRARGCFWVSTRPAQLCVWDGAGGQLSIGVSRLWEHPRARRTHLVMTGLLEDGDPRQELQDAFDACLLTADEARSHEHWMTTSDGLEPWLGPIEEVA